MTIVNWLRNDLLPVAVLVFGAGLIVRFTHWLGAMRRRGIDDHLRALIESGLLPSEEAKRSRTLSEAVEWVVVALVYFIAAILSLERLGVPLTTLVAPATVVGIGLGFGAQQMVGDLLAGFFLFAEHQFTFGDVIRLSVPGQGTGITGTVEELTLRVTKLRTTQGELVVVPNSALRQVTNLSKDWSRAVIDIPVPVDEDLEQVTLTLRTVIDTLANDPTWRDVILGDPVVAGVESIEVGYVQLRLIARTLPGRQFDVGREIRLRAATALRSLGVNSAPMGDGATKSAPAGATPADAPTSPTGPSSPSPPTSPAPAAQPRHPRESSQSPDPTEGAS